MSKIKKGFVRILWGEFLTEECEETKRIKEEYDADFNVKNNILMRRFKIQKDIKKSFKNEYELNYRVYVYGRDNFEYLKKKKVDCVLVHEDPYKYSPIRRVYQHKIDLYPQIAEDFEEFVFLDWDCNLIERLPSDFWEELNKREVIQTSLHKYMKPRIKTRKGVSDNNFIPTGAFVYMRGKDIANKLKDTWSEGSNKWSCEPCMANLTDEIGNGWQGLGHYFDLFEPEFYTAKHSPYKHIKERECFSI